MFAYYLTIVTFAVKEVVCDALTMERGNNNKRIILIIIAVLLLNCSCSKNTLKNKNAELVYDYIESDTV